MGLKFPRTAPAVLDLLGMLHEEAWEGGVGPRAEMR